VHLAASALQRHRHSAEHHLRKRRWKLLRVQEECVETIAPFSIPSFYWPMRPRVAAADGGGGGEGEGSHSERRGRFDGSPAAVAASSVLLVNPTT